MNVYRHLLPVTDVTDPVRPRAYDSEALYSTQAYDYRRSEHTDDNKTSVFTASTSNGNAMKDEQIIYAVKIQEDIEHFDVRFSLNTIK